MELFNQNDAAGVAATYTEDGKIMPPEAEMLQGRDVLQDWWQLLFDSGFVGVELEIMEVHALGDTATEVGQYTLYDESGDELEVGKYVVIWKLVDGQWLRDRNVFSSNAPDQ
jgi:ketosteroid isomerase-like protein